MLAFVFGYRLTSLPLLRSGMTLAAVAPLALASDTISITIMEIVDNAIMLAIPGAMEATLTDAGFWAALAAALLIAGAAAYPANRWLLARGKGHAVVHAHHATTPSGPSRGAAAAAQAAAATFFARPRLAFGAAPVTPASARYAPVCEPASRRPPRACRRRRPLPRPRRPPGPCR